MSADQSTSGPRQPRVDSAGPDPVRGNSPVVHATRIRTAASSGPIDRRRLFAAGLSAIVPGLGQAFNGRRRLTALFLIPSLLIGGVALLVWATQTPTRIAAWAIAPAVLGGLLTLNALILAWRLLAVGQAFLDTRRHGPTGRLGVIGVAVIALLVVVPAHRRVPVCDGVRRCLRTRLPDPEPRGRRREPTCRPRSERAGQRPGAGRRRGARTVCRPDRHDDGRLVRSGREDSIDGVIAPRSRERPAGRGRRLRPEAQLADVLRRPPPGRLPEGRPADATGRYRRTARHPDPLPRDHGVRRLHRDGRRGRRRRHHRGQGDRRSGL